MKRDGRPPRAAFTLVEIVAAAGLLAVLIVLVAELGYLSMRERTRGVARQLALEQAGNVLEAARACPWGELTPEWAAAQRLPDALKPQLPDGQLLVQVEPEKERPQTKRVTVEVRWQFEPQRPPESTRLIGLFSARSASVSGGKP